MLDRASTFAEPTIVQLLKTRFVPVAIDQAYQRRQQDTEGEFYRRIASQGPRNNFKSTTQGFYVATAAGKLLFYNNNRDPAKVRRLMERALGEFQGSPAATAAVKAIPATSRDKRYNVSPPDGGLTLRVRAKVLGGYDETDDRWRQIFQTALSRDNLWMTRAEQAALREGKILDPLKTRIARFHLVDNTRGEPPMWKESEIRSMDLRLEDGQLRGRFELRTADGKRGFEGTLRGRLETKAGAIARLDLIARGEFWGEGRYTRRAPKGRFPFAVAFTLADGSDVADRIPPQGSRGWVDGYLR